MKWEELLQKAIKAKKYSKMDRNKQFLWKKAKIK